MSAAGVFEPWTREIAARTPSICAEQCPRKLHDKRIRQPPVWYPHMLSFVAAGFHRRHHSARLDYCVPGEMVSSRADCNADRHPSSLLSTGIPEGVARIGRCTQSAALPLSGCLVQKQGDRSYGRVGHPKRGVVDRIGPGRLSMPSGPAKWLVTVTIMRPNGCARSPAAL